MLCIYPKSPLHSSSIDATKSRLLSHPDRTGGKILPRASAHILSTDKEVKAAKAPLGERRDYRVKSAPALQLRVTSNGAKSWVAVYKSPLTSTWRKFVFATYPSMPLGEARARAEALRVRTRDEGFDPAFEKRRIAALGTFGELAEEYIIEHEKRNSRRGIRSRSTDEARRLLDRDILPILGDMKAELIRRPHVAQILEPVAKRGAYIVYDRVLGLVRAIFNWAIAAGRLDLNPTFGLKRRNAGRPCKRVLSIEEIRIFWQASGVIVGFSPTVRDALRLQLLTGLRGYEIVEASLCEIDFQRKLWTIPPTRTKSRREHALPLSDFAIEILRSVIDRERAHAEWRAARNTNEAAVQALLFPSRKIGGVRRDCRPLKGTRRVPDALDHHAVARAILRHRLEFQLAGVKEPFTSRDLRRTLATHLGSMNVADETIERILNHAPRTVAGKHYVHGKYVGPMREALDAWARSLRRIIASSDEEVVAA